MFLIEAMKPKVSFRFKFVGGNKKFIQKNQEMLLTILLHGIRFVITVKIYVHQR